MPSKPDRRSTLVQETAAVSLVAVLTCVLSSEAMASRLTAEPSVGAQELSTRVATIIEAIRLGEPKLLRRLPPETKMAQWRNR